jgi:hypothetical protein
LGDLEGRVPGDREPLLGIGDCRRHCLGKGTGAEAFERQGESGDCPRHPDREGTEHIGVTDDPRPSEKLVVASGAGEAVHLFVCAGRGDHRELDGVRACLPWLVDDHIPAAADAVHPRLDHPADERAGDGGIDRVAASPHHGRARLGGLRRFRRDHAAAGDRLGALNVPLAAFGHWLLPCLHLAVVRTAIIADGEPSAISRQPSASAKRNAPPEAEGAFERARG